MKLYEVMGEEHNSPRVQFMRRVLFRYMPWKRVPDSVITRSGIINSLGEDISSALPECATSIYPFLRVESVRQCIIKWASIRWPGILDATWLDASPLQSALYTRDYVDVSNLLDAGVRVPDNTYNLLGLQHEWPHGIPRMITRRLIQRGAHFKCKDMPEDICTYQKQVESARDGSWTLIGIRKYRRSPLIPVGVHIDIVRVIARYIRQSHENIVFVSDEKRIKV